METFAYDDPVSLAASVLHDSNRTSFAEARLHHDDAAWAAEHGAPVGGRVRPGAKP